MSTEDAEMSKFSFEHGTSTIQGFFRWINERHRIWVKRSRDVLPPWTDDPILHEWKFTNVFRELDRGTLALREMIAKEDTDMRDIGHPTTLDPALIMFNVVWYRMWNRFEHATDIGFCFSYEDLVERMERKRETGARMFTSAHLTYGIEGEDKTDTMLRTMQIIWYQRDAIVQLCRESKSLEVTFNEIRRVKFPGIAAFIGYEIVTDFRWYDGLLKDATDTLDWANVGPGSKRGMQRLGCEPTVESMRRLHRIAPEHLEPHVASHYGEHSEFPPFELREIEHSLCEFDKYERVRLGQSRPKERYKHER